MDEVFYLQVNLQLNTLHIRILLFYYTTYKLNIHTILSYILFFRVLSTCLTLKFHAVSMVLESCTTIGSATQEMNASLNRNKEIAYVERVLERKYIMKHSALMSKSSSFLSLRRAFKK